MRNRFTPLLVAAGLCATVLSGFNGVCLATDPPAAKPADVEKMKAALPDKAPAKPQKARKVLVYGNCGSVGGFVHSSISLGEQTIVALGEKTGAWTATINNDPAVFDDLKEYDAVLLVSTTGNFLIPGSGKAAFTGQGESAATGDKLKAYTDAEKKRMQNLIDFVQKDGKGFAGIHAASDAYHAAPHQIPEYVSLIGGCFNQHPWTSGDTVWVKIDDAKSPLTASFDKGGFSIKDEIYQFSHVNKPIQAYSREKLHVLLSLDMADGKTPNKGNAPDKDYGVAWIKQDGKGRVFYCSLGHNEAVYANPAVVKFYLAGLQYALGDLEADAAPSGKLPEAAK